MIKIDQNCELLKQCLLQMFKRVILMHEMTLDTIQDADVNKALKIIDMDEFVNVSEEEINDIAIESLALLSPVASDLRKVIVSVKIASELERIGDYAKNISKYIIKNGLLDDELRVKVTQIGQLFIDMLNKTMNAYENSDNNSCMIIPSDDEKINQLYQELIIILQSNSIDNINKFINTVSMIRNYERAKDHTKNICEHIIFEVKGQHIEFN